MHNKRPHQMRCRPAFEMLCVHANGDVVCSIMDGRGDFVFGNVHDQSINEILSGSRYKQLQRLVLSAPDGYCPAIGKQCALKSIAVESEDQVPVRPLKYLALEPTTACNLRCLACPTRDFVPSISWRNAFKDGGIPFLCWDSARRVKQHLADAVQRAAPWLPDAVSLYLSAPSYSEAGSPTLGVGRFQFPLSSV